MVETENTDGLLQTFKYDIFKNFKNIYFPKYIFRLNSNSCFGDVAVVLMKLFSQRDFAKRVFREHLQD